MTDVALAAPKLFDVYPAVVLDPTGAVIFRKVRVFGTPDWLVVYGEDGRVARTVLKVASAGARPHPTAAGGWIVTDPDGREWTVSPGSGCGCGSSLRHLPSPTPLDL